MFYARVSQILYICDTIFNHKFHRVTEPLNHVPQCFVDKIKLSAKCTKNLTFFTYVIKSPFGNL